MSATASQHAHVHGAECDHDHGAGLVEQLAAFNEGPSAGDTQTITTQRKYAQKLRGRFAAIAAEIRRGVVDRDVLGLGGQSSAGTEQLASDFDPEDLTPEEFSFSSPARKSRSFKQWLETQQRQGVLSVISTDDNVYIRRAYDQGTRYAERNLRGAGMTIDRDIPVSDVTATFVQPVRAETLELLYERNYDLLEGITNDVSKEISRELTEGLNEGIGPRAMGRRITGRVDAIGKTRATAMARYEVLNAHNLATIQRYREAGVQTVTILTSDPCEQCQAIKAGGPYPLDEALGLVPAHPSCVCSYGIGSLQSAGG